MLLMSMARSAYISRQYLRLQNHHNQAYWLCEAGLERAVHAIRTNADYHGETWTISGEQLGSRFTGEVAIAVEALDDERVSVSVTAAFPAKQPRATRCTKTIFVDGLQGSS
jgi:type II secretory pathway component PulK